MALRSHAHPRRTFLQTSAVIGAGYFISASPARASRMANEKLNIGVIGAGGKGATDTDNCSSENIAALCDVDSSRAGKTFEKYPQAERFTDFRKMLEQRKDLDAVIVATPDHTHAVATVMAMRLGKHVYCQKPLTHTVREARVVRDVARSSGVATQMGNQGTSNDGLRRAVELIQSGVIGTVKEVHVWTNRPIWPQGMMEAPQSEAVPEHLDWDLWLGPAAWREYSSAYVPFAWRGFWDFGTGAIGDMACHTANLAFMALELGSPEWVESKIEGELSPVSGPKSSVTKFRFPAKGDRPALDFTWYEGGRVPPDSLVATLRLSKSGSLFVGERGMLFSPNDYGAAFQLIYDNDIGDIDSPEPWLPRSPGHYVEWIEACKGGKPAMSNFDYAAPMTETMLLGNVAMRAGQRIEWDPVNMKIPNCPEAEQFLHMEYRKGWEL